MGLGMGLRDYGLGRTRSKERLLLVATVMIDHRYVGSMASNHLLLLRTSSPSCPERWN